MNWMIIDRFRYAVEVRDRTWLQDSEQYILPHAIKAISKVLQQQLEKKE
ncbi:MAG: hypothetical protein WCF03_07010 [Nitrososphaeraceae archaeon]